MLTLALLLACKLPELPDVDLRAQALDEARERAVHHGDAVHLDGTGVDAFIGRVNEIGIIDAGGGPLTDALLGTVARRRWMTAFNAQPVIGKGPGTGQSRGATWIGAEEVDPPEPGSEQLWTLDVSSGSPPRISVYRGDPRPGAPGRAFALGGLEALAIAGDPEVSPSLARAVSARGASDRTTGRTYLGLDRDDGVLAIVVVEQGAAGPRLTELPDALRASGFEDVLALDGDARSALADGHGAAHLEAEGLHDPRVPARYGIGVRWAR